MVNNKAIINSLFYIRYKFWFILCQLRYQGDVLAGATVTLYCLPSLLFTIKAETLIQPYLPATTLLHTLFPPLQFTLLIWHWASASKGIPSFEWN